MFLQPAGLLWASVALLLSAAISLALQLNIARSLIWAATRSFVQLMLLGSILSWVFKAENRLLTLGMILFMTLVATHAVFERVSGMRYRGILFHTFLSLVLGTWVFSFFAGQLVLSQGAWKQVEVILPFTGLLLGNSLSGITLGLAQWSKALRERRDWIETRLAHGATRWEAIQPIFKETILTAMTPILNSMSVAGVVSLPGMMTGQLLAGADPRVAVQYQIAALFLIAVSTFFGILSALGLGYWTVLNSRHQLRLRFGDGA